MMAKPNHIAELDILGKRINRGEISHKEAVRLLNDRDAELMELGQAKSSNFKGINDLPILFATVNGRRNGKDITQFVALENGPDVPHLDILTSTPLAAAIKISNLGKDLPVGVHAPETVIEAGAFLHDLSARWGRSVNEMLSFGSTGVNPEWEEVISNILKVKIGNIYTLKIARYVDYSFPEKNYVRQ